MRQVIIYSLKVWLIFAVLANVMVCILVSLYLYPKVKMLDKLDDLIRNIASCLPLFIITLLLTLGVTELAVPNSIRRLILSVFLLPLSLPVYALLLIAEGELMHYGAWYAYTFTLPYLICTSFAIWSCKLPVNYS